VKTQIIQNLRVFNHFLSESEKKRISPPKKQKKRISSHVFEENARFSKKHHI